MSQLDVSISFNHFIGLLLCFYFFINFINILLIKFWYNRKIRLLELEELSKSISKFDNTILVKRILSL